MGRTTLRDSLVGVRAPGFVGDSDDWINTEPLTMEELRGRLVLVDFWDYTCINCIRTLPYLKEWHARYKDKGLVIVGIHTPEFGFAKERESVEQAIARFGIEYPVLLDSNYENWNAYGNRYWPHKYLVGPDGRIIYDHVGEGAYGETEAVVQKELREINPGASLPNIMAPLRGMDKPGAVCYPMTPELYLGYRRGVLGNPEGYRPDHVVDFVDPKTHRDGQVYAQGHFYNGDEFLRHARETPEPEDYILVPYHALEVNAVIRPASGPFEVVVTQDGKPLDMADAGTDVHEADGRTLVLVDGPRMYRIVANREFGSHELKLSSTSSSFAIYAFTFGSCEEPD